jgi:hypothetical protein
VSNPPAPNEWDHLVVKMGNLTLAVGSLEMAIITMVCGILGQTEGKLRIRNNVIRRANLALTQSWCSRDHVAPISRA